VENSVFVEGFCTGFLVAGVFGFVLQSILWLWARWGAATRPQVVVQQTRDTPLQVVIRSILAGLMLLLILAASAFAVWMYLQS
jgi:hypothetical protein